MKTIKYDGKEFEVLEEIGQDFRYIIAAHQTEWGFEILTVVYSPVTCKIEYRRDSITNHTVIDLYNRLPARLQHLYAI